MSESVPAGWSEYKFGEICSTRRGISYTESDLGEYHPNLPLYINMKSFSKDGGYNINGEKFFCSDFADNDLFGVCDLLIVNTDVTNNCDILGLPILIPQSYRDRQILYSHHVTCLKLINSIDKIYLYFHLCNSNFRHCVRKIARGTTVQMLDVIAFEKLQISLPPLPEQQKIASILTSVDTVIEKTEAQINKLKDLKKAMMQELLTKGIGHTEFKDSPVGRIPGNWEVNILGDKISLLTGYAFQSKDFVNKGVPLIRMGNLFGNKLDLNRSSIYLPISFIRLHSKFCASQGDLIMSMTGTIGKEDYGYVVQIPANTPTALLNQRVCKVISSAHVYSDFIMHLMRSRLFLNRIFTIGAGTKQANLSSSQILSVQLPFPSLLEQQKIASTLCSIDSSMKEKQNKLSHTKSLKKALMQDLLTGKVRVAV